MKKVLKEIPTLIVGAILGIGASAAYDFSRRAQPQLTVRYTVLASELPDYVNGNDNETPDISLHKFSWKNTGNQNLKDFEIEFAPAGGDAAYDEKNQQRLAVNRALGAEFGRTGVTTTRVGNVLKVHYARFPVDAIDNITITSPSIVADYEVVVSDPDIQLVRHTMNPDFEDPIFAALRAEGNGWLIYGLSAVVVILSIALAFVAVKRRRP